MLNDLRKVRALVDEPRVDVTDTPEGRVAEGRAVEETSPPSGSLADIPFDNAAADPDAVVVKRKVGDEWTPVTAAQLRDEVVAVARGLIARGVEPGSRVGIMARTSYEWMLLDLATWAAGGVVVPLYPTSSAAQVRWILTDSATVACAVEAAEHAKVIADAGVDVAVWNLADGAVDALVSDGASVPEAEVTSRRAAINRDDVATLIYTSGTTGNPKGCVITHRNLLQQTAATNSVLMPPYRAMRDDDPSTILFLPLAHVYGRTVQLSCLRHGILLGHFPSVRPDELRPELARFGPTFIVGVPYLWEKIRDNARAQAEDMGKAGAFDRAARIAQRYGRIAAEVEPRPPLPRLIGLRLVHRLYDLLVYRRIRAALGGRISYGISGGSALSADLIHFFTGAGIPIYEGYGLTETCAGMTINPPMRPRPGTVGRPVPGAAVRIAPNGEVQLRGPMVFQGYRGRDGDVDSDGWFSTGDLGELDDDGYLTITGRAKEIIVTSGGKNVSPVILEDRLRSHPLVSQCVVVGDGRPFVAALVTIDPEAYERWRTHADDTSDTALHGAIQEAVDDANAAVSRAESIRAFTIVPEEFTEENGLLTPSLKLRRGRIHERYAAEIAALYAS
ncbi:MAG TPA: AMP-dependent synthetase/ligase [Jiangellaceae bacterium]